MAANATGSIARLFGMSRPVDTGPIQSYKPTFIGNMTNTNVIDTSTKLTYDVKQELTIDPATTGLGPADEMAISSIAARESYLTQFPWSTSDVPETLLWNCYVEPMLYDTASPSGKTEYHYTPMAYAALPFENWRGTIKYRFQVIASSFHKGRLKVIYEPYFNNFGSSEYNVQYTQVIDLASERDFTVEIGWGQEYSYLDHRDLGFVGSPFSTTTLVGALHGQANGLIGVYVVNDLTTPSATLSDVSVIVSVSAGDSFEVINPNNNLEQVTFWQPQSALEEHAGEDLQNADGDLTTDETAPVSSLAEVHLSPPTVNSKDDAHLVYFGDPVTSIRQVLKRYELYAAWCVTDTSVVSRVTLPDFPVYRGYAVGSLSGLQNASLPADPTPYNYVSTTVMNYFTPLFLTRRGGLRHKYVYTSRGASVNSTMSVRRLAEPDGYSKTTFPDYVASASPSEAIVHAKNRGLEGGAGMVATQVSFNPTLEIELPFHTNQRFMPARQKNFNVPGSVFSKYHQLSYGTNTSGGGVAVLDYVAAGEDFSLSFFQACPVFWRLTDPAPSTTN
jgi:hypothetical protein